MRYAIASGLRGFSSSSLRVFVERETEHYAWVITADLRDAGTRLVLDADKLIPIEEPAPTGYRHASGLITLTGGCDQ